MPENRSRSLRELSRVLFARWLMVLFIIAAVTGATLAACLKAPKSYRSSVTFLAKEPRPQNPTAQQVSTDRSLEVFIKTQNELITSQTVLARTLAVLRNPESAVAKEWMEAREAVEQFDKDRSSNRDSARDKDREAILARFTASLAALDREVDRLMKEAADYREDLRQFAKKVKVKTPGGEQIALSEIFTITVTMPGPPERAWQAADLLARNYVDRYRQLQAESGGKSAEFMRTRLDAFKRERLARAEAALRDFVENELESPSDVGILEQLSKSGSEAGRQIVVRRFQEELIDIDAQLASAVQLKRELLEQLPEVLWGKDPRTGPDGELTVPRMENLSEEALPDTHPALIEAVTIIPEDTIQNNVVVNQLKGKEVALLIELNRLQVEFAEQYRAVRDKQMEIARTRRQILRELVAEASARDIAASILRARQNEIKTRLDQETRRLDRTTSLLVRYQELQNELAVAREEYRRLSADLASAEQFQNQEADAITISIVDPARVPDADRPAFPNTILFTVIAGGVGVLLAFAYAFMADHFDHTFRTIGEAEHYLGVPVVGSIGRHRSGLVT